MHCSRAIVIQYFTWYYQDYWAFVLIAIYTTLSKLIIWIILCSLGGILDREPMSMYTLDRSMAIVWNVCLW